MSDADFYLWLFGVYTFFFGACIGSFLNVCIWRLPRNESVVRPRSHCPNCGALIKWYQNIPIVSWCCLRGRCANCHKPIVFRYTLVELLGGVLFLAAYLKWAAPGTLGMDPARSFAEVPVLWLVIGGLILGAFIDLEHFYLPDRVTIGGMILGVPLSLLVPSLQGQAVWWQAGISSVAGAAFGFFFLWGVGALFTKILKKEALGFGDVKLIGAVGAFFGPIAVLFTIIVSSFVGAVVGIGMILRGRAKLGGFTAVPYGPFLAMAALAWVFYGPAVVRWYLSIGR